ncbi:MAG: hypothetical protein NTV61_06940 [Candidatus Bathyarchaeota archaeon]|nr:hypothetical protein [Candidatus Bathyarchaeota archaeon]
MENLDFLINLSLALIAVDISIYAIAIPLLQSELKLNFIFLERKLEEVKAELKKINENPNPREGIKSIKQKIKEYELEEKKYASMLLSLRFKGAVIYPCICFFISILFLLLFQNILPSYITNFNFLTNIIITNVNLYIILSLIIPLIPLCYGMYKMFCTLNTIDFASTNIPLPDFDISFFGDLKKVTLEGGTIQELTIEISNIGYDVGELVQLFINIPPELRVIESEDADYSVFKGSPLDKEYPNWWMVSYSTDYIHVDSTENITILIETPPSNNVFKIPIWVAERKINQKEFHLDLEIKIKDSAPPPQ